MLGKVLIVVVALVAGAGGAYAYQLASENLEVFRHEKEEDPRIVELQGRLSAVTGDVQALRDSQQAAGSDSEVLTARINTLDGQLSELREKQAELAVVKKQNESDTAGDGALSGESAGDRAAAAGTPVRRISGEALVEALKDMPDEGREMIRKAIYHEIQRIKKENGPGLPKKEELHRKAAEGIRKLAVTLSLTPLQVEQAKEIALRHIDRLLEVEKAARELDDPGYAENAKKEIQAQLEREVIEALTPEQVDKMRELDPDGFGKRHPRGF